MIEVRGLSKTFAGLQAVQSVSFRVNEGDSLALLGPNGSGKTTTLKCLAGLSSPTAGQILIHGNDIASDAVTAKTFFSYLPQRVAFPEQTTAREVLQFFCRLRHLPLSRAAEAFERWGFGQTSGSLVSDFSGGMLQRLGIAVATLPDAPILLLDEPTASLDPEGAAEFRSFVSAQRQAGKTIVFSTHILSDVDRLADRVAFLVGGRLIALDSVASLRSNALLNVKLHNPQKRFREVALAAGAVEAWPAIEGLKISAAAARCYLVLRALEEAGARIAGFVSEEPTLEEIYLRYVDEDPVDSHPVCGGRLQDALTGSG